MVFVTLVFDSITLKDSPIENNNTILLKEIFETIVVLTASIRMKDMLEKREIRSERISWKKDMTPEVVLQLTSEEFLNLEISFQLCQSQLFDLLKRVIIAEATISTMEILATPVFPTIYKPFYSELNWRSMISSNSQGFRKPNIQIPFIFRKEGPENNKTPYFQANFLLFGQEFNLWALTYREPLVNGLVFKEIYNYIVSLYLQHIDNKTYPSVQEQENVRNACTKEFIYVLFRLTKKSDKAKEIFQMLSPFVKDIYEQLEWFTWGGEESNSNETKKSQSAGVLCQQSGSGMSAKKVSSAGNIEMSMTKNEEFLIDRILLNGALLKDWQFSVNNNEVNIGGQSNSNNGKLFIQTSVSGSSTLTTPKSPFLPGATAGSGNSAGGGKLFTSNSEEEVAKPTKQ